jgi:hypothetical protein
VCRELLLYYENNVSALLCTAGIAENDGGNVILVHLVLFTVKPKNADY